MENSLSKIVNQWRDKLGHSFDELSHSIVTTHLLTQQNAIKAVNQAATLRNWLIGCYIVEYEQKGVDRAKYGDKLLKRLEKEVCTKGLNETLFRNARIFYKTYPKIACLLLNDSTKDNNEKTNHPTISDDLEVNANRIHPTVSDEFETSPLLLVEKLSFSHIVEILKLKDKFERFFYETECIKSTWSVKELRRQISTNLYFRCGASANPKKLLLSLKTEKMTPSMSIRQPFAFEFLGLKAKDVITENDLEDALIRHLQEFLLEMGKGFCFEARQKRVIIDDEYYYADLVFYNRILHCNIICEIKNDEFKHESLGQLNAYVSYYRDNEMRDGDNPPIGILLCTKKGKKMVEYAIAGMDNKLFVSTYMLQLPDKKDLENFLIRETQK